MVQLEALPRKVSSLLCIYLPLRYCKISKLLCNTNVEAKAKACAESEQISLKAPQIYYLTVDANQ